MKRIAASIIAVLIVFSVFSSMAEDLDLSVMTKSELEQLRGRIDAEIKENHSTTYKEEEAILGLTEKYIEEYLTGQGASSVSWPWFDYTYSKDWNFYTVKTTATYKTSNSRNETGVYSELYGTDGTYGLYYVVFGDTVLLDNRSDIPDARFNGGNEVKKSSPSAQEGKTEKKETPVITPTPEPKTWYGFNEKAVSDGISYTMLGYRESKGSMFNEPANGNVYLLIEFLIENNSKSTEHVSYFDFSAYCDDYSADISFAATLEANPSLSGEVAPGKRLKGEIGIEVPRNWKEIELHLSTGWFSDDIVFKGSKK